MAMDKKQKGLIALTVIALGFLGYQVFQLVSGDMSQGVDDTALPSLAFNDNATSEPSQVVQHTSWQPQKETPLQRKLKMPNFSMKNAVLSQTTQPDNEPPAASAKPALTPQQQAQQQFASAMQRNQQAYLKMINEYELAKMQRQLLDEKAAIATAQNKIINLDQQNRALGAKSSSDVSGVLTSDTSQQDFRLSYLDKQDNQWSATLSRGDEYQQVNLGTWLPGGYKVVDISHDGVILQNKNKRQLISFNGVVQLPDVVLAQASQQKAAKVIQRQMLLQAQNKPEQPASAIHALLQDGAHAAGHFKAARVGMVQAGFTKSAVMSTQPKQTLALEQRTELVANAYHVAARDAVEAPDKMVIYDDNNLPLGMHLRSVSLDPIVREPYQSTNYLPPEQALPQSYHLISAESGSPNKYDDESIDTDNVKIRPKQFSEANCGLLHLSGDLYTIQLIGTQQPKVLSKFIASNHVASSAMRCAAHDKLNHDWYMALYGSFPSFADAEAALVNLPNGLRYNGPFVRKVSSVQAEVKRTS